MSPLKILALVGLVATLSPVVAKANPISIVAAENFYGDVARQIGGADVAVTSILSNPDQDPHLFEADPSTARILKTARIVISNGIDYDPWMETLLKADAGNGRRQIVVADLLGRKAGDNPHLWYDPATMSTLAKTLAIDLGEADPGRKAAFGAAVATFDASLKPLGAKIAAMKAKYAGVAVTASEPVFGYMAGALGLDMHNKGFQLAVMNGTEPSASDVAAFEDDLKGRKVKVMIYNSQADDQAVKRLVEIAKASKVPVVGVTETEPAGKTYQAWMLGQLDALDHALAGSGP
ncbi:MAG TPA: zinc ABC transporter substrate-binding protein [Lichenihabitans sp.]|jgi:zinc/manganese transport system substrate-binding protein|nr:zinc ABC transporter substrate-binding protein [Lichenihabitans sp.]